MPGSRGSWAARALAALCCLATLCLSTAHGTVGNADGDKRVLAELYVMSRCLDAHAFETYFNGILDRVGSITRVKLHFIETVANGTVTCKHAERECTGNKQLLCVQHHADSFKTFWDFLACFNQDRFDIGSPELTEKCTAKLPPAVAAKARLCFTGREGDELVRIDAAYVAARGVARSATFFVAGKKRCERDQNKWADCAPGSAINDFVRTICDAYWSRNGEWPQVCGEQPAGLPTPQGTHTASTSTAGGDAGTGGSAAAAHVVGSAEGAPSDAELSRRMIHKPNT